jgi:hypothetical protein
MIPLSKPPFDPQAFLALAGKGMKGIPGGGGHNARSALPHEFFKS